MATSGTDTYSLTRDQIIRAAFETIGVASINEPLEAEDIAVATVSLNALVTSWKTYGLNLWKRGRSSITLVASDYDYDLVAVSTYKPMRLLDVTRKDSDSNEIGLTKLSLEEYESLPNKTTTGVPVNYYFEPKRTDSTLYIWPAPDATAAAEYTIEYVYQQAMEDMDVGTEDVDFPNEWYRALIYNLANDLSPKYGLPLAERQLIKREARDALDLALDYDVEDVSMYIRPDMSGYR